MNEMQANTAPPTFPERKPRLSGQYEEVRSDRSGFPHVNGVPLRLMTGEELAEMMLYDGVTSGFRAWCRQLGIRTVPGRKNVYDPVHVRARIDAAHENGLTPGSRNEPENEQELSFTERSRIRRNART
ncbi:hypothetical protein [Tropicimonas sp. IMCC34011]|uniref:hypothetical protein n=1 Tax=Tropicimonas sp. IMCC34011 TaxID=2248759 RepID=UPI000E269C5D|nr:hypothetical protein [Tropicimonas sp. IMCC34011]